MMVKPDGSGARALTTGPGNAGFPSWSPDGRQVVYRFWDATRRRGTAHPQPVRRHGPHADDRLRQFPELVVERPHRLQPAA